MRRGKGGRELAVRRLSSVPSARGQRLIPSSCWSIIVAVLSLASGVAIAQAPPPVRPDAGAILEQQREPLRLPPPPDADVRPKLPEPKPALPVSPTLKVRVTRFNFSGNTLFDDDALRAVVQEFIGKELDFEGLTDAATKVRAYHRERGYFLAQAYLPQQAIRDGVVEIAIIEGRVGVVELQRRPATRLAEWLLAGILNQHLKSGDIITETGLEKPLLLINDLPTAAVTSEIRPSQTVGAADLRVNVDQGVGLFNGYIDFDNHGSRFTGAYRLGGSLNMNNPLTIGDQVQLRAFATDEEMYFGRFAYLVPVGFWGTRIGFSVTEFSYKLGEEFASLQSSGDGLVKSVYAFHPIYRTRNSNVIAQLAYEDKRLFDRVDDPTQASTKDQFIDSLKVGVVGDFRDRFLGGGLNAFSITYTHGDLKIAPDQPVRPGSGRFQRPEDRGNLPQVELRLQAPEPAHRQREPAARAHRPAGLQEPQLGREALARRAERGEVLPRRRSRGRQRPADPGRGALPLAGSQIFRGRRHCIGALRLGPGRREREAVADRDPEQALDLGLRRRTLSRRGRQVHRARQRIVARRAREAASGSGEPRPTCMDTGGEVVLRNVVMDCRFFQFLTSGG